MFVFPLYIDSLPYLVQGAPSDCNLPAVIHQPNAERAIRAGK
jgi:hypothetical protein